MILSTTANYEHLVTIKIDPIPKPRMTKADAWKKRKCVMRYWDYKAELLVHWKNSRCGTLPNRMAVIFYIEMPKSWSKKKKEQMIGAPHQSKPDADNLMKAFKDCLLDDDARIWDERSVKLWSDSGRIEVYSFIDGDYLNEM